LETVEIKAEDEDARAEVRRLKICIGDLLSLSATHALTRRCEPERIVGALLEVLIRTLRLDLAYAELKIGGSGKPIGLARSSLPSAPKDLPPELRISVEAWLADPWKTSPSIARMQGADGKLSLALVRLGSSGEMGWLLACSRRADFPTQTETLILGVAANQGAIGVQQAQLLGERARIAKELERKVKQRTKELRTANGELERALKQVDTLREALQWENLTLREHAAGTHGGLAPWQLRRAKELLSEDLSARVQLSQLAQACRLSVRHFTRAFRHSTGLPPHRWLLSRRVERAKQLLRDSLLSLTDVAVACGFGDQSHFTRMFSASVGLSPGLWRRVHLAPSLPAEPAAVSQRVPVQGQRTLVADDRAGGIAERGGSGSETGVDSASALEV